MPKVFAIKARCGRENESEERRGDEGSMAKMRTEDKGRTITRTRQ